MTKDQIIAKVIKLLMNRQQKIWQAINAVTELADELMTRNNEELERGDLDKDERTELKANTKAGCKAIATIWDNAELLKTLLGVKDAVS